MNPHLHNNDNTIIPTESNIQVGMTSTTNPCQGETLLLLILPLLGEQGLAEVAKTNKNICNHHWKYMYNFVLQKYPRLQLEGPTPSVEQMAKVDMYLPPRIVIFPNYEPENRNQGNNNVFPVPLSAQPVLYYDPRQMETFESWSLMDKTKALQEYAANVETLYSSLTAHRAEEQVAFANQVIANFFPGGELMARDFLCLLNRSADLRCDLKNYPCFLQCFNEHEQIMLKLCFLEKLIKATVHSQLDCRHRFQFVLCLNSLGIPLNSTYVEPFLARHFRCL